MLGEITRLTNVIQVMLSHRTLPCQLRASPMWEFNPADPWTLKRYFDTTHEDKWKKLLKAQKNWPKKTEDVGHDIKNPASEVSITLPKTCSVNMSNIIKIISSVFCIRLDG